MTSLESRIALQETLIKNALDPIKNIDVLNLTKSNIQTRLEVLESNWAKFDKDHDRICEAKTEVTKDLPYMKNSTYAITQKAYMKSKSTMLELLSQLVVANPLDGTTLADTSGIGSSSMPRMVLPKIQLPKFAGDYQSWGPFCDMFTSLMGADSELTNVMKMHYLKSSVTGEAANLISSFQITGDNFTPAWDKLIARYENKRVLINKHLDTIFKMKPLLRKSAKGLNHLLSTVNESLGSLKALGSPTNKWDQVIVYTIVNRLDSDTHEAWEIHEGASMSPSSFVDLERFIEGRTRALESIESRENSKSASSSQDKPTSRSANARIHVAAVENQEKVSKRSCSLCNSDHYLTSCKAFGQKTQERRRQFLVSKRLCFNCLGPHLLRDCRSLKSCLKCRRRHHTMIHDAITQSSHESPTTNSTVNASSSSKDVNPSTSSVEMTVNHTSSMCSPTQSMVLLATAQVRISGPDGNFVIAKALIDQGSEISFISERLVQNLQLYHPSWCPAASNWPHISGLKLADPSFMTPSSIDLILGAEIYGNIILADVIKGPPHCPIAQSTIFEWILSGPINDNLTESTANAYHCSLDVQLDVLLQRFWDQEEIIDVKATSLSPDEEVCEQHFLSTHSRLDSGRYVVRLPLKESPDTLETLEVLQLKCFIHFNVG